jgi:predicted dehydrogenase
VAASALLWLEDGRVGAFDCGFTLPPRGWLEITGTEGVLRVPDMWQPAPRATFTLEREGRPPEEVVVEGADQVAAMVSDFAAAVLDGAPVRPDPEESVRTLRVLDALALSAQEDREVDV